MILEKLINVNTLFDTIIGGNISEYDIQSAGSTAIRELKGEAVYNDLMTFSKKERNIRIGLMMRDEPGLSSKVNALMLKYLNMFITKNKIKASNLIYTTRDSIVVYNKIPMFTEFGNVKFRNKDGAFSSMYRFNRTTILFDIITGNIVCKGVGEEVSNNSPFLQKFLSKHLRLIESCQKRGETKIFNNLKHMRESYINSQDISIYQDILNDNRLGVKMNGEVVYFDGNMDLSGEEGIDVCIDQNYINFILPIMRSVLLNG